MLSEELDFWDSVFGGVVLPNGTVSGTGNLVIGGIRIPIICKIERSPAFGTFSL